MGAHRFNPITSRSDCAFAARVEDGLKGVKYVIYLQAVTLSPVMGDHATTNIATIDEK